MTSPESLVSRYLDNQLDSEGFEQLSAWLREDEKNRQQFVSWCFDHRATWDFLRHQVDGGNQVELLQTTNTSTSFTVARLVAPVFSFLKREPVISTVVAALVVGIALGTMALMSAPEVNPNKAPVADGVVQSPLVAMLRAESKAVWSDSSNAPVVGDVLQAGQRIELLSGFASISLFDGAEVLLEGPVVFQLRSSNGGYLEAGRLVGHVSDSALGLEIETGQARIVDLGTEFGVEASSSETVVQVFSGEVEITRVKEESGSPPLRLGAGQAVKFFSGSQAATRVSPQDTNFVRSIRETGGQLLVYEPFGSENNLALVGQQGGYGIHNDAWAGDAHPKLWTRSHELDFPKNVPFSPKLGHLEYAISDLAEARVSRSLPASSSIKLGEDQTYYLSFLARKFRNDSLGLIGLSSQQMREGLEFGWSYSGDGGTSDPWALKGLCGQTTAGSVPNDAHQFLVVKIVAREQGEDRVFLKAYDSASATVHDDESSLSGEGSEEGAWTIVSSTFESDAVLDELTIRCDGALAYVQFDEIRIGTTWSSVTGL